MKTIKLADHELSISDFSNFELNLLLRDGRILAKVKTRSTDGMKCLRVADAKIMFDEAKSSEARIEALFKTFGFQRRREIKSRSGQDPDAD